MKFFSPSMLCSTILSGTERDSNPIYTLNGLDYIVSGHITADSDLSFSAPRNLIIEETAIIEVIGSANVIFEAGKNSNGVGNVLFKTNEPQIFLDDGELSIYYNPGPKNTPKYTNPTFFTEHVDKPNQVTAFMWVNDVYDLQNIRTYLAGNYALSQDIEAIPSINHINNGQGFQPIFLPRKFSSFTGHFDGRHHTIRNVNIKCGETDRQNPAFGGCGLFGRISKKGLIENLVIDNCTIEGDHYVGTLFGSAESDQIAFKNITLLNSSVKGNAVVGILGGSFISHSCIDRSTIHYNNASVEAIEQYYDDVLFGAALEIPRICRI